MAKLALNQLEQATAVPDGSMYLVEMGDGSGTKTVTQEKLEERIGDALKVGNLDSLQTENKESLVDAINEAAQSGGGGSAVDILDTQEEIEANTVSGKSAGALGVKEMYAALIDKLGGFTPVLNETGEITGYKTTAGGADTVFPFRGSNIQSGTVTATIPYKSDLSHDAGYSTVTFPKPFSKTPKVYLFLSRNGATATWAAWPVDITTTGFRFMAYTWYASKSTVSGSAQWIAIE